MNKLLAVTAFLLGAIALVWMGANFVGSNALGLTVILVIGAVYTIGFIELIQFRQATATLSAALGNIPAGSNENTAGLGAWLGSLHPSLQNAVRLRIEGERVALPAPIITPYLVGLLVMLGLLGTFAGMVDTLRGAVVALEGTTELQAIREGLTAPIKGLSLAFGTSVAGVAASAMLGLVSTLSRRDRMLATRRLDTLIGSTFRSFSLAHNRQETYQALQAQAQALPEVALKLEDMADKLARMGDQLGDRLAVNQEQFHASTTRIYTDLASSVDKSLRESLAQSGRLAGESITPVVREAMEGLSKDAEETQRQLGQTARDQLEAFSGQFESATTAMLATVNKNSTSMLEQQAQRDSARLESLNTAFGRAGQQLSELTTAVRESSSSFLEEQAQRDTERLESLNRAFAQVGQQMRELTTTAREDSTSFLEQQARRDNERLESLGLAFAQAGQQMSELTTAVRENSSTFLEEQAQRDNERLESLGQALAQAGQQMSELSAAVSERSAASLEQQGQRDAQRLESLNTAFGQAGQNLGELTTAVRAELEAFTSATGDQLNTLRNDEERRGEAAVERLGQLEETVAKHLASLGKELEEPMTRLIQTASETPRAAAEVIGKLREEISNNIERDNSLLEDRRRIMEELNTLSGALADTARGQRETIEKLVADSGGVLQDISLRFEEHLGEQLARVSKATEHFSGSSAELASLGEAFGVAVNLFSESNAQLVDNLLRIEEAMDKSSSRSDEQMSYYVAQAREIIDQSMLSQREIFEQLQQLEQQQSAPIETS